MSKDKLSIAILGSRGIPNQYGGYETCAQELGMRLVDKGHLVTVYSSHDHPVKDEYWHGIKRELVNNPEKKLGTVGQFIYDMNCNLHSRKAKFDVVLHLGYTSDSIWYWLWPKKSVHLVNMDGQEWKRSKFSSSVRMFLMRAERFATYRSKYLIADSKPIEVYLAEKYKNPLRYIAYGATIPASVSHNIPEMYGLETKKYDLLIARMEPENNVEMVIRAKLQSNNDEPLVIIGNQNAYKTYLINTFSNQPNIKFLDAIYDEDTINSLRFHCRYYIHGHSVGGTNPSLLEAMSCSCIIFSHENPFNKAVLGNDAMYFDSMESLTDAFKTPNSDVFQIWISNNLNKIKNHYNWDLITDQYETLFYDAVSTE